MTVAFPTPSAANVSAFTNRQMGARTIHKSSCLASGIRVKKSREADRHQEIEESDFRLPSTCYRVIIQQ
jgi:hypothetical protein